MQALAIPLIAAACPALLPQGLTREQMRGDLGQLVTAVREEWSHYEDRSRSGDVDLAALTSEARQAIEDCSDHADFAAVLRRFVAGLHDGHAVLRVDPAPVPERELPFELVDAHEGLVVSRLHDSTGEPDPDAPRVGDLLVAVDGVPVEDRLAAELLTVFGSTPSGRRRAAIDALCLAAAEEVICTFEAPPEGGGAHRTVRVATLDGTSRPRRSRGPAWSLRWPREDVALLRIASFKADDWRAWLSASPEEREPLIERTKERIDTLFREIAARRPRALVLDLRGNGGGTDSLGIHVAKHLVEGEFRYFLLSGKVDGRWTEPAGLAYQAEEHMSPYRGPVVALIDARCFSTTDNLLRCLADLHPDLTTIGRATGGGTGAPRVIASLAHSGAEVTLCTQRVLSPAGGYTEGRGTVPDVPVRRTRAEVIAGGDPALAAALARIDSGSER